MLKIFNIINTAANLQQNGYDKTNTNPVSKIHAPNLAPLKADTLSFTSSKKSIPKSSMLMKKLGYGTENLSGRKKDEGTQVVKKERNADDKKLKSKERTISNGLANQIYDEACRDTTEFKGYLTKLLKPLMPSRAPYKCNKEHPVYSVTFRTKSANSIREKASQKFLSSREGVKNTLTDIIGAKIILGDGMQGGAGLVIDKLIEAVQSGKLRVIEVENHTPRDIRYQYASQTKLHKLVEASSEKYGNPVVEKITKNETGYSAIHILTRFPDGYIGEIQILGYDVAQLKDLDDIPYKILQGKSVDSKYKRIREILSPMLPVDDDPDSSENIKRAKLKKEFVAYTSAAYKHAREAGPVSQNADNMIPQFLTLDEFAQMYKKKVHLTPDMDLNHLYRIKTAIDWLN